MTRQINPNSDKDFMDNKINLADQHVFPIFLKAIRFNPFRHIDDLSINFEHPISVISGTNKSGKSTILMALACSHLDFQKRDPKNGSLERQTWSSLMKFTNHDKQDSDWSYFITYKQGTKILDPKRGQRKKDTQKWNGIGKKESQFNNRQVVFIDLDRIIPARYFSDKTFALAKTATLTNISHNKVSEIEEYVSYILEDSFVLSKIAEYQNKDIFKYKNNGEYSSYNAASGEEVLTKMVIDIVEAKKNSLILIDEIEVGLHPKVQRRMIDVLYNISRNEHKQFIITSHSPSILSSLPDKARIFIEKRYDGKFKSIPNISVNAALSKMDSASYPLIDLYCEDKESRKVIENAITSIQAEKSLVNFERLINIICSDCADLTYSNFKAHQRTYDQKRIKTGFACVLDGDRRELKDNKGHKLYPPDPHLHFLYSMESPEKFLIRTFLAKHPNRSLEFHLNSSNSHCLFDKMVENTALTNKHEAFDVCWSEFLKTTDGKNYFDSLKSFILSMAKKFSPEL